MPSKSTDTKATAIQEHKSWNTRCLDTWLLEILAASFSIACLIAICAILLAYDGNTRPDLKYGLTLNAIISVLATGCKSSLLFMIGESLSQIKWIWFRGGSQPLLDMQTFDSASRGPLGSMIMIFQRKRSLATFGAAMIVMLLPFDPFIQQITRYPTRSAPIRDGGVAVTKRLKYFVPHVTPLSWNIAYSSGIWSDDNLLHANCSSGNCTWPIFRSIGVCNKCTDITPFVTFDCHKRPRENETYWKYWDNEGQSYNFNASCDVTPPLGHATVVNSSFTIGYNHEYNVDFQQNITWLVYSGFDPHYAVDSIPDVDNYTFTGVTNPLNVLAYAKIGYEPDFFNSSDPLQGFKIDKVTECSLAICLGDWQISVNQGTTMTEASDIDQGQLFWRDVPVSARPNMTGVVTRNLCWRPASSPSNVSFDYVYVKDGGLKYPSLSPVEFAFCGIDAITTLSTAPLFGSSTASYQLTNDTFTMWDYLTERGNPSTQRIASTSLEHVMSNVANSLNKMALNMDGEDVNGAAYGIEVFVMVQWTWLIVPGLVVISGNLFFILVLLANKKTLLWKSSIFAFLYHGLGDMDRSDCMTASSMEKEATKARVQLRTSHENGDLKLERE
ncbi:hypothetical protein N7536_007632 [Penicillium majusculum]|uniref:Uncharacterized protein n=1 Tax=Penicillium solitum TaxID=60172 RepID=A0A1V6QWU9_9EURO|nr:uncharacterized protein PENSOL_c032G00823 [Penicillium solitum]KAJ5685013.1 hypothetical protein N7536_007632 [Penicillium majusculum]OQD93462.1 hypothetical protein PENSOL_c032G00823 [Penicillium solitum]